MSLYDINGNDGKVGLSNLSSELVNEVMFIDETTPIVNLLDISKVEIGRYQTQDSINPYLTGSRTSDYIPVKAGWTYVAQSWDGSGNTGGDHVILFDENKAWIEKIDTGGNGTIRYAIFKPTFNGYIRYTYNYSETANPMVFVGVATSNRFVVYTSETLQGEYFYELSNDLKNIIQRDVEPNNLFGRRVYMIGDSNMDNWASANKELFEKRYGCTVTSFAEYGATFEVRDGNGIGTTARGSAVGQWNLILQKEPINEETLMLPEDIAIFFMMGTNCHNKGTESNRSDMNVTTALGAMEWVFTQISYYCRGDIPVGVILPVQSGVGHDNIIWSAERHGFPYINPEKHGRLIQDNINSSIKAESYIVTGNHIASHGWKHFRRIVHNWMAYNV